LFNILSDEIMTIYVETGGIRDRRDH